jgi:murein DD-endopeptidase MepM/ murein hydrolase activator NlpD
MDTNTNITEQKDESLNKSPYSTQLQTTYNALAPQQKASLPIDQFAQKVTNEQARGINEDVAIGNVMMSLPKYVPPPTIVGKDKAQDAVSNMQAEVDKYNQPQPTATQGQPTTTATAESPELQGIYDTLDSEYNEQVSLINQIQATSEQRAFGQLDSIRGMFDKRKEEMKVYNQNRLKALEIMGGRTGRQRYAPEIQSGILSAEEKEGMDRLSDINLQEIEAMRAVENALQDNEFAIAQQKITLAKDLRKEKTAEVEKLYQRAKDRETSQEKTLNLALASPLEFAQAGININDSYKSAVMKITPYLALTELKKQTDTEITKEEELTELLKGVSSEEELQARFLAKEFFGDTKGAEPENIKAIAQMLVKGYSIPEIRKMLKDSGFVLGVEDEDLDKTLSVVEAEKMGVPFGTTKRQAIELGKIPGEITDSELDKILTVAEAEKLDVPFGTTKREAIAMGRKPGDVITASEKIDLEIKISDKYLSQVKDPEAALQQLSIMETAGNLLNDSLEGGKLNAISQGILVTYQKLLDPTSVVRESEYARSSDGQSLLDKIEGKFKAIYEGGPGVLKENLKGFVEVSQEFAKNYKTSLLEAARLAKTRSNNYGLDINNILTPKVIGMLDEFEAPRKLPILKKQYNSFDELIAENSDYTEQIIETIKKIETQIRSTTKTEPNEQDVLDVFNLQQGQGFNQPLSMGGKGYLGQYGEITGEGSPYWEHGLDIDLKIGDPVFAPVGGKVIASGVNGGFGNQVKIKGDDGREYWLSHLDSMDVKKGDTISANQIIGKGGNTGKVIAMGGGDGSHLDLTVKDENGNYIPPKEIKSLFS